MKLNLIILYNISKYLYKPFHHKRKKQHVKTVQKETKINLKLHTHLSCTVNSKHHSRVKMLLVLWMYVYVKAG